MNDARQRPRPRANAPTLADVARVSGVSTATVSRALNSPQQVVPRTRERVLKAVNDLGYAPNSIAQALAARRTNTIGTVIPTMENAVFARGIQAFQEELGLHGKTLLIASSSYRADLEDAQIRTLVARGADALVLIGYDRDPAIYEFLQRRGIPTLVTWSFDATSDIPTIGFDNRQAMADMANLVLSHGHTRLGMISALTSGNDRARARVEGVRQALSDRGLPPESLTLVETTYAVERGAEALRRIIDMAPDTTAVLCGNDVLAFGALRAARDLELQVPRDLSITGFDDIELARLAEPGLTTVHVPHREMGRRAAQMLIAMLEDDTPPRQHALPTRLALRDSLGTAPQR